MKYLVLGGSGFIGSSIRKQLSMEQNANCLSMSSALCDLRDPSKTMEVLAPVTSGAVVVYAAGIPRARSDTFEMMIDNITMVRNVVDVFQQAPPRLVIFISTVEIYGVPDQLPITEHTTLRPVSFYGVGKVAAELMLGSWQRNTGIPLAILRLPGVYGPGDQGRGFIGALMRSINDGREFNLFGDGNAQRDYVFVEDVAKVVACLKELRFDQLTINLATGTCYSLLEIIDQAFVTHGPCPLKAVPDTNQPYDLCFDNSLLRKSLPHLVMTSLSEGLERYPQEIRR